ncbi:MAG: ribonuclease J [Bdellovibrionales bacterium]
MKITPLGGLSEVGMNCMVLELGDQVFIIDCGTTMSHSPWLGYDAVYPDFKYLKELGKPVSALILTHAHEDHVGAIPNLLMEVEVPVIFCGEFTSEVLRQKLEDFQLSNSTFIEEQKEDKPWRLGATGFEFVLNNHSIFESYGVIIRHKEGNIFHSGDFRIDQNEYKDKIMRPAQIKKKIGECFLMFSDSTNSEKEGWSEDEKSLDKDFQKIFNSPYRNIYVTCFASNVRRTQHFVELGLKAGYRICPIGRSMHKFLDRSHRFGLFQIPSDRLVDMDDLGPSTPNIMFLITGSQGEQNSALMRLAKGEQRRIKLQEEDLVLFSSLQIPGNETKIRYLKNLLSHHTQNIIDNKVMRVHSSGHAFQEEQLELLNAIKPRHFVPVHGDRMMLLRHAKTAREDANIQNAHVLQNYQSLRINGENALVDSREDYNLHWKQDQLTGFVSDEAIAQKRRITKRGLILIKLIERHASGVEFFVRAYGVLGTRSAGEVQQSIISELERLSSIWYKSSKDKTHKQYLDLEIRRFCKRNFPQRPAIDFE